MLDFWWQILNFFFHLETETEAYIILSLHLKASKENYPIILDHCHNASKSQKYKTKWWGILTYFLPKWKHILAHILVACLCFTNFDWITHASCFQNNPSSGESLQGSPEYESVCLGGRMTQQRPLDFEPHTQPVETSKYESGFKHLPTRTYN